MASSAASTSTSADKSCAICLGKLENASRSESCSHAFCFVCLLEWSKVRAECPLCKKKFSAIRHSYGDDEDDFRVHDLPVTFRYATTAWRPHDAQDIVAVNAEAPEDHVLPAVMNQGAFGFRRRRGVATSEFRRRVYQRNLYVEPMSVSDAITGRYRECGPRWFRNNPAQKHRLVPWLNRELNAILREERGQRSAYVLDLVLNAIESSEIRSAEFHDRLAPYLGNDTEHFQHEFYYFARSVYDMIGFDRHADYTERQRNAPPPRDPNNETLVISSDDDDDDDIEVVHQNVNNAAPSSAVGTLETLTERIRQRLRQFGTLAPTLAPPQSLLQQAPVQASAQNDTGEEGNDDVEIVDVVPPRHLRQYDVIDLSDREEEEGAPGPSNQQQQPSQVNDDVVVIESSEQSSSSSSSSTTTTSTESSASTPASPSPTSPVRRPRQHQSVKGKGLGKNRKRPLSSSPTEEESLQSSPQPGTSAPDFHIRSVVTRPPRLDDAEKEDYDSDSESHYEIKKLKKRKRKKLLKKRKKSSSQIVDEALKMLHGNQNSDLRNKLDLKRLFDNNRENKKWSIVTSSSESDEGEGEKKVKSIIIKMNRR